MLLVLPVLLAIYTALHVPSWLLWKYWLKGDRLEFIGLVALPAPVLRTRQMAAYGAWR